MNTQKDRQTGRQALQPAPQTGTVGRHLRAGTAGKDSRQQAQQASMAGGHVKHSQQAGTAGKHGREADRCTGNHLHC
jgi:hypothetical protein